VDFVAFEDKVEPGDWFYTSGDDRIFPRGMPVGIVKAVRAGQPYREITLDPSGMVRGSPDDVLIVVEGVHQEIPDTPPANQQVYLAPAPPPLAEPAGTAAETAAAPADGSTPAAPVHAAPGTEADKARALYQKTAEQEDIVLGGGSNGMNIKRPPDFTKLPVDPRTAAQGRGAAIPPVAPMQPAQSVQPAQSMQPAQPVQKKGTAPPGPAKGTGPADVKAPPDAVRRANQAGGGPGGIPQP
jgi:rod shape-determining protein MreC